MQGCFLPWIGLAFWARIGYWRELAVLTQPTYGPASCGEVAVLLDGRLSLCVHDEKNISPSLSVSIVWFRLVVEFVDKRRISTKKSQLRWKPSGDT